MDHREMHFQSPRRRSRILKLQQSFFDKLLEIHADRTHVANDLILRLFKRKKERSLTARASGLDEVSTDRALSRSSGSRNEYRATTIKTVVIKHRVEACYAGRNMFRRRLV